MGGGLAAGLAAFVGHPSVAAHADGSRSFGGLAGGEQAGNNNKATRSSALGFAAIGPSDIDDVVIPPGYALQVLIPWGDPLVPGGPAFAFDGSNSAEDQAHQFGMGHDGMHFFRLSNRRGLLVVNHEAVDYTVMFDAPVTWTPEEVLKAQNAHGVAICELEVRRGWWTVVDSGFARRITALTPMEMTGPADRGRSVGNVRARNDQQLRKRCHAVGDLPLVRGELQRLLRNRRSRIRPGRPDEAIRRRRQEHQQCLVQERPAVRPRREPE
jgi:secreted PhoX family phosphatase